MLRIQVGLQLRPGVMKWTPPNRGNTNALLSEYSLIFIYSIEQQWYISSFAKPVLPFW